MVQTVPDHMEPGSDVANLSLLGYNPAENYTGRAPIEAAGAAIPLQLDDVAYRCNLITVTDGLMDDYSAGHITTDEARQLIEAVEQELGRDGLRFYTGVSYRHLLVWRDGPVDIKTQPPHDVAGQPEADHFPKGDNVFGFGDRQQFLPAPHIGAAGQKSWFLESCLNLSRATLN